MLNKKSIIAQVVSAIKVYPSNLEIMRENRVSDGFEGYIVDGAKLVASVTGFIDTSGLSFSIAKGDGGTVVKKEKIQLILPYSEGYELKQGDYFTHKGITYRVKNPNMQFEICYLAEIEVI